MPKNYPLFCLAAIVVLLLLVVMYMRREKGEGFSAARVQQTGDDNLMGMESSA